MSNVHYVDFKDQTYVDVKEKPFIYFNPSSELVYRMSSKEWSYSLVVASKMNKQNRVKITFPVIKGIASIAGVKPKTAEGWINRLIKLGVLKEQKNDWYKVNKDCYRYGNA